MNNPEEVTLGEERWLDNKHNRINEDVNAMLNTLRNGTEDEVANIVDLAVSDTIEFSEKVFKIVAKNQSTLAYQSAIGAEINSLILGLLELAAAYKEDKNTYDPVSDFEGKDSPEEDLPWTIPFMPEKI